MKNDDSFDEGADEIEIVNDTKPFKISKIKDQDDNNNDNRKVFRS